MTIPLRCENPRCVCNVGAESELGFVPPENVLRCLRTDNDGKTYCATCGAEETRTDRINPVGEVEL